MLGVATAGILVVGPAIVGFIPIMVVGALIFMLGIELLEEALVDTWGKLHRLEYLTVGHRRHVRTYDEADIDACRSPSLS